MQGRACNGEQQATCSHDDGGGCQLARRRDGAVSSGAVVRARKQRQPCRTPTRVQKGRNGPAEPARLAFSSLPLLVKCVGDDQGRGSRKRPGKEPFVTRG